MPRPVNPNSQYTIKLHTTGGYTYASTQPPHIDPTTGKKKYTYKHWGTIDQNNKFIPNTLYYLTPPEERAKLIFPKNWDLSETKKVTILFKDLFKQRRSIRKYKDQTVSEELVLEALNTAAQAPSAHNAQPWRFITISDKKVRQKLVAAMAEAWMKDLVKDGVLDKQRDVDFCVKRFNDAPVFIVACLIFEGMHTYFDERYLFERDLAVQSLGAALQNMLLFVSSNGLGACCFSAPMFCKNIVREVLGIPETVEPTSVVLMGYPDEKPIEKQQKEIGEFCFRDTWGKQF
ncbi:MAG: nitroreductase family protein [Candidatus Bathyarchaeota archaeon]|nr:nitroreductase family protein [Candidatus Termiticorpusculum sp.]